MQLRVAFASSDRVVIDQHFGAASAFAIHEIGLDSSRLIEVAQFIETAMDGHEGKLDAKIALLDGCSAVFSEAVGASAIQRLLSKGVQPVKVENGTTIDSVIAMLQGELKDGPTGWLAKAVNRGTPKAAERFADMEEEGWSE